jgi:hypothetical protein
MKTTRRKALALLGGIPIAGPLLAKQLAEREAMQLSGIRTPGLHTNVGSPIGSPGSDLAPAQRKWLFNTIPTVRAAVEALAVEETKHVHYLDADLGANRSMSLAAKIYHQRQRNKAVFIRNQTEDYSWNRMSEVWKNASSLLGISLKK